MPQLPTFNYKTENSRYRYYYRRLFVFYQKPAVKVSTALLFTIGTIIFFAIFAIHPTLQTIAELLRKIGDQKQILVDAQKKSASLATAQQQYIQIEDDIPTLEAAIPDGYNTQQLIRGIEAMAGSLSIPVTDIKISNIQYPSLPSANEEIQELPFSISLNTSYPLAKQFITSLQLLPRLIIIDSVSIMVPEKNKSKTESSNIQVSMNCRVFYLVSQGVSTHATTN